MATKEQLLAKAAELNIEVKGEETNAELEAMIKDATPPAPPAPPVTPTVEKKAAEPMVKLSDVKALIAEALAQQADKDKPVKVKRVTEHMAHVWRLNGKWVVDFADRNFNYETGEKIDQYIQAPIHAYTKYNPEKRENESWIKVIFNDGSTEDLPLNRYVERRTLVYCTIIKRHPKDLSYSIGEVERKKEGKDGMMVGTGVMVDQDVNMYAEVFEVRTPEGEVLKIPDYAVC